MRQGHIATEARPAVAGRGAACLLSGRAWLLALGLLLHAQGTLAPARAAAPDWPDDPYAVDIVEQDVIDVLRDFAGNLGISIQISERVTGTVRGRLPALPPVEFLDLLAQIYGLAWYYDGATLYVYNLEEVGSRFVQLGAVAPETLRGALEELDIYDDRFPFRASTGLGAVYVSGPPRYLELVAEAAELLSGRQPLDLFQLRSFPLRYATAVDRVLTVRGRAITVPGVATILRNLLENQEVAYGGLGFRGAYVGRGAVIGPVEGIVDRGAGEEVGGRAAVGALAPGALADEALLAGPAGVLLQSEPGAGDAVIQADARLNAVVIRDNVSRMPIYEQLINELDQPTLLVEIEVLIADVATDHLAELGVDWRLNRGNDFSIGIGGDTLTEAAAAGLTLSTVLTGSVIDFVGRIQALERQGDARVLSRPSVLTFDHQDAVFDQSESFFVRVTGEREAELVEIQFGTLLVVTPHVVSENGDRRVQLIINVEDGSRLPGGEDVDDIPSVRSTQISTQALVGNQQALVIGGFYRDSDTDTINKVPVLGDIPVLGKLFFRSTREERQSLARLFMIRPLLVDVTPEGVGAVAALPGTEPPVVQGTPPGLPPAAPGAALPLPPPPKPGPGAALPGPALARPAPLAGDAPLPDEVLSRPAPPPGPIPLFRNQPPPR